MNESVKEKRKESSSYTALNSENLKKIFFSSFPFKALGHNVEVIVSLIEASVQVTP